MDSIKYIIKMWAGPPAPHFDAPDIHSDNHLDIHTDNHVDLHSDSQLNMHTDNYVRIMVTYSQTIM